MSAWQAFAIGGFVVVMIFAAWILSGRTKKGSSMDREYITGEPTILDEQHGECYILGISSTDNKTYQYKLQSDKGVVFKNYTAEDLMDVNKHLNLVGRQIMVTKSLVSRLSGNMEFDQLKSSFDATKRELEEVQAKYQNLLSNFDTEIQKSFDRAEQLGKAFKPSKMTRG